MQHNTFTYLFSYFSYLFFLHCRYTYLVAMLKNIKEYFDQYCDLQIVAVQFNSRNSHRKELITIIQTHYSYTWLVYQGLMIISEAYNG